jgi:NADH-quinone oxidoreductase subunit J
MSPWLQHVVFVVVAVLAAVSALLVVTRRNPIYSALFLVIVLGAMALLFLQLGADFLGFMQLLVYAGAIMVLYLFVIMLINPREGDLPDESGAGDRAFAGGTAALVFCLLWFTIHESELIAENPVVFPALAPLSGEHGSTRSFGLELFREHLLVFELASVLILVGIVGATHLSLRARPRPEGETPPPGMGESPEGSHAGRAEEIAHV